MPSAPRETPLDASYRAETAALVGGRLPYAVGYYLLGSTALLGLEWWHHPERGAWLTERDLVDFGLCAIALASVRLVRRPPWPSVVAALLVAWILLANAGYAAAVGGQLERFTMVQVALLNLAVVLFPWGARAQLVPVLASFTGYAFAAPLMRSADAAAFCALILAVSGVVTVLSAGFADRSRWRGFIAQTDAREQADVAAALYQAARAMAPLDGPGDVLGGVVRVAAAALGCDWSCVLRWDPERGAFRLAAETALGADVAEEIGRLEFGTEFGTSVARVRAGDIVEVADTSVASGLPPGLLARWRLSSLLATPMCRGDAVVGVLVTGYRTRREPFASRHRQVQEGLAQIAAVALENVRLVTDLRAADRFKTEFVSTMSHELRTPLNVILGFTEIARDVGDGPERERALERVDTAARELFSLIEDTLEMGRIECGRDGVRLQETPLRPLLAALERDCVRLPRAAAVAFRWKVDVPDATVLLDPRKLTVIVRNLVGNACKFTEHGMVTVWVTMTEGQLVLTVMDTGIGIAAADREAIFEMFRQGDGGDSRRFGGLGLGLHITRRFVGQLGGTIEVASEVGRGSTFGVRLPLASATRSDAAA